MPEIPRGKNFDSTLLLLRDPYRFIQRCCREHSTDLFQTRILLRRTICLTGRDAAELFYDPQRFTRVGAAPGRIQETLFGKGGVQGLEGDAHYHRKAMFMSLVTGERVAQLADITAREWRDAGREWASLEQIELYAAAREVLTRSVCAWAGVPLAQRDVAQRTRELTALFDYAGAIGPKHWWSRLARKQAERWAGELIERVRAGTFEAPEQTPVRVIAAHRERNGDLLSPRIAAVELLNILRPTVAVAVFVTFAAHALHTYPECRRRLAEGEAGYDDCFAQEVRRFYPFFPAVLALVKCDFDWQGWHFPAGTRAVLDLYGTDHDARLWDAPEEFRPERFAHRQVCPFDFIPQGGDDAHTHHRCPGEEITVELIKVATRFLSSQIDYDVPRQDLSLEMSRLPALPRSRFLINNARAQNDGGSHPTTSPTA